jgi:hypothetical protein
MNECKYTFEPITTTSADKYMGRMGIVCPRGGAIKVTAGGCTITIGEQVNLESIEFINNTTAEPKKDETWTTSIKRATYMQTGFCPGGIGIFGNMSVTGSETVKGESSLGEPVDVWISD